MPDRKCCPDPPINRFYTYVDSTGVFFNMFTNTYMNMISWDQGLVSEIYGKCVAYDAAPYAYGDAVEAIDCPCCPEGYVYIYNYGCANPLNIKITSPTIPCIDCVCPPDEPVVTTPCPTCDKPNGAPIVFDFNPFVKNCENCNKEDQSQSTDAKLNKFIPYLLLYPNINLFNLE